MIQPYGLNTPAAFAFVFNIIYTIFFANVGRNGTTADQAFILGYKVALAANFITGLILIFLGIFGRLILKIVPPAALLVPIAGLGISFLGLEQLAPSIAAPLVGYPAIMWCYIGWYAGVKVGYKQYRIPEAVMVILVGVILGWATGLNQGSEVQAAAGLVRWWGPTWTAGEMFSDFNLIADYLGIVIPIGISAAATTLMCLVSAKEAGDPYPVVSTSDGARRLIVLILTRLAFAWVIFPARVHGKNEPLLLRESSSSCVRLTPVYRLWMELERQLAHFLAVRSELSFTSVTRRTSETVPLLATRWSMESFTCKSVCCDVPNRKEA